VLTRFEAGDFRTLVVVGGLLEGFAPSVWSWSFATYDLACCSSSSSVVPCGGPASVRALRGRLPHRHVLQAALQFDRMDALAEDDPDHDDDEDA
jgi:hypothetical protein